MRSVSIALVVLAWVSAAAAGELDELIRVLRDGGGDDAAVATGLLDAANRAADNPTLRRQLAAAAYDYGLKTPKGHPTAVAAARVMVQAAPHARKDWQGKLLDALERTWRSAGRDEKPAAGEEYVQHVLALAEESADCGACDDAIRLFTQAQAAARSAAPSMVDEIGTKLKELRDEEDRARQLKQLKDQLAGKPDDIALRERVIIEYVLGRGEAGEARKFLTPAVSEVLRTCVPLAAQEPNQLAEGACLDLANWYRQLAPKTALKQRAVALEKALVYYERFLELHTTKDIPQLSATTALQQVMTELASLSDDPGRALLRVPLKPGLIGRYRALADARILHQRIDGSISFEWARSPAPGVPEDHFTSEWTGVLNVPAAGTYRFAISCDDVGFLWIDGEAISSIFDPDKRGLSDLIKLTQGRHIIRMIHWDHGGRAAAKLLWSKDGGPPAPVPASALGHPETTESAERARAMPHGGRMAKVRPGLQAVLFRDPDFKVAVGKEVHAEVLFKWGDGGPDMLKGTDKFAIRWTGYLYVATADTYHLEFRVDDHVWLWIDGMSLLSRAGGKPAASAKLSKGLHELRIDFRDTGGPAHCCFFWQRDGNKVLCPVPPFALFH